MTRRGDQPRDEQGRFVRARGWRSQGRDEHGRFARLSVQPKKLAAPAKLPVKKPAKRLPEKKPARAPVKRLPVKKPVKAPVKRLPVNKPARAPAKRFPEKKPARAPVKRLPEKKPAKAPVKRLPEKKPARAPVKRLPEKKPAKAPVKRLPVKRPARPPAKKPARPVSKRPPVKKRRRPERPLLAERSSEAEREIQEKLIALQGSIEALQSGLDTSVKTFVNRDGTVDGELRVGNLPDDWRTVDGIRYLVETLSSAFRAVVLFDARPAMGGAFWATFGVRFGPQNEAEIGELNKLYKRYRGLFQIGTYPTPAWGQGAVQVALSGDTVGLRAMMQALLEKRGLPPTVILIRYVWTPDGQRPSHYAGEK